MVSKVDGILNKLQINDYLNFNSLENTLQWRSLTCIHLSTSIGL